MSSVHDKSSLPEWLARVAIIGIVYSLAAVIAMHLICPEYDAVARPLSDYATSRGGWLIATATLSFAVSVLALARGLSATRRSRAGIAPLYVAGFAYLVASIFPTDARLDNTVITLAGAIHFVAGYLSSPALVAAVILLAREPRAFAFAVVLWASLVILVIGNILQWQIGGLGQRIFFALTWLWLLLTAVHLRQSPDKTVVGQI